MNITEETKEYTIPQQEPKESDGMARDRWINEIDCQPRTEEPEEVEVELSERTTFFLDLVLSKLVIMSPKNHADPTDKILTLLGHPTETTVCVDKHQKITMKDDLSIYELEQAFQTIVNLLKDAKSVEVTL